MTKEQREELYDLLVSFAEAFEFIGVEFEDGDEGVNIVAKEKRILDFIESEVEKAKKEKEMEIANYFSIESAIGEKKLRRGVEYVVIKMSEYERLIKGLRI